MGTGKVTLPPLSRLIVMPIATLIALLMVMLLIVACGYGDLPPTPLTDPSTTPTVEAASVPTITTSAVVGTPSSTPGSTEPLTDPTEDRVGSQAKFEEQVDAVYARLGRFAAPRDEVPFPDATNPDPVIALQSLLEFHYWVMSTNPWRDWVPLYALDGSRYSLAQRNLTTAYGSTTGLYVFDAEPFTFLSAETLPAEAVTLSQPDLALLADDAVALEFISSVGNFRGVFSDTGETIESMSAWTERPNSAVLAPTSAGWRILYLSLER